MPGDAIYEHVRTHLDPAGWLEEPGVRLPDEDKVTQSDDLLRAIAASDPNDRTRQTAADVIALNPVDVV